MIFKGADMESLGITLELFAINMCLIYMNYILGEIKDELKKRR
jgi:hypothetical protein